jgi:hypothetical protein
MCNFKSVEAENFAESARRWNSVRRCTVTLSTGGLFATADVLASKSVCAAVGDADCVDGHPPSVRS